MTIKVIVNGANGRMGQFTVKATKNDPALSLVAALTREDDLAATIRKTHPDVVVDFTNADAVYENSHIIIEQGARPVIGSTGLKEQAITELQERCRLLNRGGIIAPNFSMGAVLLMRYARDCAHYLPHVEIIEMHHDGKLDAPSGTAIKTAQIIAEARSEQPEVKKERELIPGSRGGRVHDIPIHA